MLLLPQDGGCFELETGDKDSRLPPPKPTLVQNSGLV